MKPCSELSRWQRLVLSGLMSLGIVMATFHFAHAERYSLTDLGSLGGGRTGATAINNSGEVAGWSVVPGNIPHVFLYKNRMIMSLGITAGNNASAYGINDSEQIVGQTGDGHAFVYDHGHVTILPGIISGGYGGANAINTSGVVVGWAQTSATSYAVMYNHGIMTNLNVWRGAYSVAYDINDSGHVVGEAGTINYGPRRAFLYKDGTMKDLGTLNGAAGASAAFGINNAGQVVGQAAYKPSSSEVHAFLYTNGKMIDLGSPIGITITTSSAKGINKSGQIVGWYNRPGYGRYPFIYQNGSMHNLNTLLDASGHGWSLSEAIAINDYGQIICKAGSRAVLLTPVP